MNIPGFRGTDRLTAEPYQSSRSNCTFQHPEGNAFHRGETIPASEHQLGRRGQSRSAVDEGRHAHAVADAQGDRGAAQVAALELVEHGGEQHRAGGAERVAQRDRAAVDVDLVEAECRAPCATMIGTGAKASLISQRSMSFTVSPARFSAFCVEGIGPVSMSTGSEPATAVATMRARGFRPSERAFSVAGEHAPPRRRRRCPRSCPAWITPFSLKTGLSAASDSAVVEGRQCSSVSKRLHRAVGGGDARMGAISRCEARRSAIALPGLLLRARGELVELAPRVSCHFSAISSAETPLRHQVGEALDQRRRLAGPSPGPTMSEPIGTRFIDSTPPPMASSAWPAMMRARRVVHRLEARAAEAVHRLPGDLDRQARREHRAAADVEALLADLRDAADDHVVDLQRVEPVRATAALSACASRSIGWTPTRASPSSSRGRCERHRRSRRCGGLPWASPGVETAG